MLTGTRAALAARTCRVNCMTDSLRHKECDFIIISLVFDLHGQGKSQFVGLQHGQRVLDRIAEVQEYSAGSQWNHVPGKLNPADKGTRGLTAAQLASDSVWWNGPEFLVQQHTEWPSRQITVPKELSGMVKRAQVMAFAVLQVSAEAFRLHPDNYSSWKRLVRVTALCYRFINRCRRRHASTRGIRKQRVQQSTLWS